MPTIKVFSSGYTQSDKLVIQRNYSVKRAKSFNAFVQWRLSVWNGKAGRALHSSTINTTGHGQGKVRLFTLLSFQSLHFIRFGRDFPFKNGDRRRIYLNPLAPPAPSPLASPQIGHLTQVPENWPNLKGGVSENLALNDVTFSFTLSLKGRKLQSKRQLQRKSITKLEALLIYFFLSDLLGETQSCEFYSKESGFFSFIDNNTMRMFGANSSRYGRGNTINEFCH